MLFFYYTYHQPSFTVTAPHYPTTPPHYHTIPPPYQITLHILPHPRRMLSVQQTVEETFDFLSRLLLSHPSFYTPSPEINIIFQPRALKPSLTSLNFLFCLLHHFDFQNSASISTRFSLLQWLLPSFDHSLSTDSLDGAFILICVFSSPS